ncbi:DNA repair protein Rev1 isoform X2 [Phlebotomus argentipes]|uniref:DNA repair protein Rev1 isoform X2 n=1 Tax=Phlebotomus argentipes TaxID=94469 RepID=UPI00289305DE|nr:DNA repair protein Rev1 isoform X2 [Phlebotomus argentipes]
MEQKSEKPEKQKRTRRTEDEDNGFAQFGGYMDAKISKLEQQFLDNAKHSGVQKSSLFSGISIYVNGHTNPSAEALKMIMMEHGGVYHTYERSHTTFIVASNLPDVKVRKMQPSKTIIKPEWIVDCLKENKILDHKKYLYEFNHKVSQPKLSFSRTAVNPNFLSEFYSNSRLHHISTLGLALKDYVNDLREKHKGDFPARSEINVAKREETGNHKAVMHIDMDCFFVSVGLRSRPNLRGIPVAVTHSKGGRKPESSDKSWSEIASCSYEARQKGIKNGMFMGNALKLCPDLQTIPYDFDQYKEVSYTLYDSIARYTLDIEAVSCDEMFVDLTDLLASTGISCEGFVTHIRHEIRQKTNCPCSVGIGENRLLARLATRKAKPDGQYFFPSDNILENMQEVSLRDLPGVGWSTCEKLSENGWKICGDLQNVPLNRLQKDFGSKAGENLYNLCRGQDNRPLNFSRQRKSVSTEVNYGIRFTKKSELEIFLRQLSEETSKRLHEVGLKGKSVTLKLMIRAQDAPVETAKFMGHGMCDHMTKSSAFPTLTDDPETIFRAVWRISEDLQIPPEELRGIGVQVTKLCKADAQSSSLVNLFKQMKSKAKTAPLPQTKTEEPQSEAPDLDLDVLQALPEEMREEILQDYSEWKKTQITQIDKPSPVICMKLKNVISSSNILAKSNWMTILSQWINSSDAPKLCDVEHFAKNACEFIKNKNICDLYSQLEYLLIPLIVG